MSGSCSELTLAMIRPGRSGVETWISRSIRSMNRCLSRRRRDGQLRPADGLRVAGQQVEEGGHVGGDVAVAGHQADVGVEPGGAVVVVAGGQVDVAADAAATRGGRSAGPWRAS